MSEETLGLGQREIQTGEALTQEELDLVEKAGLTINMIWVMLGVTNAKMTVNAAIGGALSLKKAFAEGKEVADPRGLGITDPEPLEKLPESEDTED